MCKNINKKGLSYSEMTEKTRDFYDNYCRDGLLIPMEQIVKRHSKIKAWSVEMGWEILASVHCIMNGSWVNTHSIIDKTEYTKKIFREIHGEKYDYSKFIYKGAAIKSTITCLIHGDFEQKPNSHLSGRGCWDCRNDLIGDSKRYDKEKFEEKGNIVHNNKYDYSKVIYVNSQIKVIITCSIHGDFKQTPSMHLSGQGCFKCGIIQATNKNRDDKNIFEEKSNLIHNYKYDYSKVIYVDTSTYVTIICPKHGDFRQKPTDHIQNRGCPTCKSSKGELLINEYLNEKNILFESEKTFKKCRNKNPLPFDFYLEEYNLCIEYDGRQHFESINIWGGKKGLKKRQKHDQIKNDYCKENGIDLLRIPYYDKHRIPEILDNYFSNN